MRYRRAVDLTLPQSPVSGLFLAMSLLVTITNGCASDPCPEGVLEGNLIVRDGGYEVQDPLVGGYTLIGTPGNAGIEDCRVIRGTVHFVDGLQDFSDFDALEHVMGRLTFGGDGYPTRTFGERTRRVVDGFNSVRRIDGDLNGGDVVVLGLNSVEHIGGNALLGVSLFALREVGGDIFAGSVDGTFAHLANLESVGRDLTTDGGDFGSLASLRSVGRDLHVGFSDEVDFRPPALEEVRRDLKVENNRRLSAFEVPALARIGGRAHVLSNGLGEADISATVLEALAGVEIGADVLVCANGGGEDPCPWADQCYDYFESDYCCGEDPCMGHVVCRPSTEICDD